MTFARIILLAGVASGVLRMHLSAAQAADAPPVGIPIGFDLEKPGYVTLVIEDEQGHRVRNLISEKFFQSGHHTISWDGLDDIGRVGDSQNVFKVAGQYVSPGRYTVRGLTRDAIGLAYQFSVYSEGNPPWRTSDRSSEWLGDHMPPRAIAWVDTQTAFGGKAMPDGQVLVGTPVTEGGSGLAWLDMIGHKIYGQTWVGGVWTGASELAVDRGKSAVSDVIAYAAAAWEGGGFDGEKAELRLSEVFSTDRTKDAPRDARFGTGLTQPLLRPHAPYAGMLTAGGSNSSEAAADYRYTFPDNAKVGVSGLAIQDGLLVAALPKMDRLLFVDAKARRLIGEAPVPTPAGIAFDGSGRLLMIDVNARTVVAYDVAAARVAGATSVSLPDPKTVISTGLDAPQRLAVDREGRIYVSDQGDSHQVKVFSADGVLQRILGKPGRPDIGVYDPAKMHFPMGISVDAKGNVWVAEEDQRPKRVSVWTPDGQLIRALYGPGRYSGGGTLSPDKKHVYYDGIAFAIDWNTGKWNLASVLYRDDRDPLELPTGPQERPPAPERPFVVNGTTYFTNSYTTHPTNVSPINIIWREESGRAIPAAMIARVDRWSETYTADGQAVHATTPHFGKEYESRLPLGATMASEGLVVMWCDDNGDGKMQPSETTFYNKDISGCVVTSDLSFVTGMGEIFKPTAFTGQHVPRYDFSHPVVLVKGARAPITTGGGQVYAAADGWTILTVPPEPFPVQASVSGAKNGVPMWTYPSLWPGLHPSHNAPLPEYPGELIGTTRLLGPTFTPRGSNVGEMWAINGDKSNVYLFTTDGLFVATLFKDSRQADWSFPAMQRGMDVSGGSTGQESFYPTITQTNDGEVYLTIGARDCPAVIKVNGLESIRRLPPQPFQVTAKQIDAAREHTLQSVAAAKAKSPLKELKVKRMMTAPKVDGDVSDWADTQWADVDPHVKAALAVSGDRLYGAFQTSEPDLLKNSAENLPLLFIGGGGIDVMLATDPAARGDRTEPAAGDLRLVIASINGKSTAVLYRPTAAAEKGNEPFAFRSPVRTLQFADVRDVSQDVTVAANGRGVFEFSIPLSRLGLKIDNGPVILRGDLGVLRGSGVRTRQRAYWSNDAVAITSDVPSEAQLLPQFWGKLIFQP